MPVLKLIGMVWRSSLIAVLIATQLHTRAHGKQCTDNPKARTLVLVGGTGAGKSTFTDICLDGDKGKGPAEVSAGSKSKTQESTCYIGEYLNNANHRIQHKTLRMIDSPGFGDTGGFDVRNMKMLSSKIKEVGKLDAVVMVWKLEQNGIGRMTKSKLDYFTQMRMIFGPRVWKRLVVVYTFAEWSQCKLFKRKLCTCFKQEDLEKVHVQVMNDVVHHMQATVEVEELLCEQEDKPGCIPNAPAIPYMASGAYLDLILQAKEGGVNFFDPDSYPAWQDQGCANLGSYDAIQFQNFWQGLENMTESPPLRVDQPNGYTECEEALKGTIEWKIRAEKHNLLDMEKMKRTARHIIRCFECRIGSKSTTIEREYKGSKKMQVELAFVLQDLDQNYIKYLNEAHGFDEVQPIKNVLAYKDYESYFKCHSVVKKNDKKDCFFELSRYHEDRKGEDDPETRKIRQQILETLQAEMTCKCHDTDNSENRRFSCSGGGETRVFDCAQGQVCNQDMFVVNFGIDPNMDEAKKKHCKPAKTCHQEDLAEKCGNIYFFPNMTNTYKVCKREKYCTRNECCTSERKFQLKSLRHGTHYQPMCMSATPYMASGASFTWMLPVVMRPCNEQNSNQQWKWKEGGRRRYNTHLLVNPALEKCIQAEGDQHYVSLQDCNKYSAQQQWKYVSGSRTIFNPDSGKVLDVRGAEKYIKDATGVIIWGDNAAANYRYTAHQSWYVEALSDVEFSRKFQEGVDMFDMRGGTSASLACVGIFAVLAVLLAARALRKEWTSHQYMEESDTLLRLDNGA